MKQEKIFCVLLILIFTVAFCARSYGQEARMGNRIYIDVYDMQTDGDSVYIDFDLILKSYPTASAYQTLFTPVVSDMSGSTGAVYELPGILIEGKQRAKLNRRIVSLKGHDVVETDLYHRLTSEAKTISDTLRYAYTFAYQPWMANARLDVLVDKCGCGYSGGDLEQSLVAMMPQPITAPFTFTPEVHFIVPQKEAVKERVERGTAYITFQVAKHNILPDFGNNAAELRKIHESIAYIKGEPTTILNRVTIRAYASPEGTAHSNLQLSQRRADALKAYVQSNYHIPAKSIRAEGMGENWEGLEELIAQDDAMSYRQEALRVIHQYTIEGGREGKLMQLANGVPYRYLLATHFPKLRRSDYEIKYTVPGFDVAKAKEVFNTRPGMLSLEEMFLIAQSYEKGSPEFNRVFDTAARLFPEDKVANLNAAAASLYKGDTAFANEVLERYKNDPEAWNNLGVLRMKQNRIDEAEALLNKALQRGDSEAAKNLDTLRDLKAYQMQTASLTQRKKSR